MILSLPPRELLGYIWSTTALSEMRDRAFAEARDNFPELRRYFFGMLAEDFVPVHTLKVHAARCQDN